jgi:hypothetical protein
MGMQAAGHDSLSGFIGSGMGEHGPWDKEIHDAKLNVGTKQGDWSKKLADLEAYLDTQFFIKVETAGITTETNVNFEPPPETDGKKKRVLFAKDGIGADNRPEPAFTRDMTADEFLSVLPVDMVDYEFGLEKAIRDGATVAPLALDVRWLDSPANAWRVTGHDGGKRAAAIRNIDPTMTIPVRMYVHD